MNSVQGYKGFITFLILSGILFTVLFGFNYISETQGTDTKASVPAITPLNITIQNVTETTAEISWTTQDSSEGIVAFTMDQTPCTDPSSKCIEVKESNPTTSHQIKLINLNSNTEYYFYIKTGEGKYYPEDRSKSFVTKQTFEPMTQVEKSVIDESSGIVIIDELGQPDFEGIQDPVFNLKETKTPTNDQATFESLIEDDQVLGRKTSIVDQMVAKEFKEAVIFNDTKYDFNKDGSVTVADYPLFIEFINNRED